MILVSEIFRIPQTEFLKSFEIIIQTGAILAVVALYIKILLTNIAVLKKLLAAFIPTGIVGFALYEFIKGYLLANTSVVLWSLFVGGVILIIWEKYYQRQKTHGQKIDELSYKRAFIIGLFQSLSVIPGVSRAASTIVGGMTVGLGWKSAVEFSFLLAVPIMIAATGLDLAKSSLSFSTTEWGMLAVGFAGAFVTALLTVKFFLRFVEHHTFAPFGIYRIVLAVMFWVLVIR